MTGPATPEVPDAPDGLGVFDAPPAVPGEPSTELAYAQEPPEDARLAHPAARAFAFALDGLATVVIVVVVVIASLNASFWDAFWAVPLVPLGAAVLDTVLTALRGVTPAKAIVGIRVVDVDSGAPIGFARSALRSLVIVAPVALGVALTVLSTYLPWAMQEVLANGFAFAIFAPVAGWVALLIVLATRPRHRGLQDLAGRSVVVRVR